MFSVLFEVHPKPDQWHAYLGYAKMLKPELEQMEGFPEAFPLLHREQRDALTPNLCWRHVRSPR